MKKEILNEWLENLESGKYKLQRGRLKGEHGFCPLGILCDMSKLSEWIEDPYSDSNNMKFEYLGQVNYLPEKVAEWAGLRGKEKSVMIHTVMTLFDQKIPVEHIVKYLKRVYKIDKPAN